MSKSSRYKVISTLVASLGLVACAAGAGHDHPSSGAGSVNVIARTTAALTSASLTWSCGGAPTIQVGFTFGVPFTLTGPIGATCTATVSGGDPQTGQPFSGSGSVTIGAGANNLSVVVSESFYEVSPAVSLGLTLNAQQTTATVQTTISDPSNPKASSDTVAYFLDGQPLAQTGLTVSIPNLTAAAHTVLAVVTSSKDGSQGIGAVNFNTSPPATVDASVTMGQPPSFAVQTADGTFPAAYNPCMGTGPCNSGPGGPAPAPGSSGPYMQITINDPNATATSSVYCYASGPLPSYMSGATTCTIPLVMPPGSSTYSGSGSEYVYFTTSEALPGGGPSSGSTSYYILNFSLAQGAGSGGGMADAGADADASRAP